MSSLQLPNNNNNINNNINNARKSVSTSASENNWEVFNIWLQSAHGFTDIPRHSALRKAPSLYCKVMFEDTEIYQTRHIRASYTPEWWDSFNTYIDPDLDSATLKLQIMDYHRFSKHIIVGEGVIHVKEGDETIEIKDLINNKIVGYIKISIRRNAEAEAEALKEVEQQQQQLLQQSIDSDIRHDNDIRHDQHSDDEEFLSDDDNRLVTLQHSITMHTDNHISPTGEDDLLDIITQTWSKYFGLLYAKIKGEDEENQKVTLRSLREAHIRKRTITLCSITTITCIFLRIVHWQVFLFSLILINFGCRYLVINRRSIMRNMFKKSVKRRSNNVRLWLKSKFKKKHKKMK